MVQQGAYKNTKVHVQKNCICVFSILILKLVILFFSKKNLYVVFIFLFQF